MKVNELEQFPIGLYDVKDQLKQHVYRRSKFMFSAGDKQRDAIQDTTGIKNRQAFIKEKIIEAIGELPAQETPLNPEITGTVECDGYKIEKIIIESRPQTKVTCNLYVPDGIKSPCGAVLFVCGHTYEAKHCQQYQMVCQYLVQAGLVVLSMDPIGQGERLSYYEEIIGKETVGFGTGEHFYAGVQCLPLGDSLAKYFLHDSIRALDYLCSRPEVDPTKIGVTGNSGGGVQSSLLMMYDRRIAAAAPATFIKNKRENMYAGNAQDSEQIWPGFTGNGLDHEDILIAMAPKPVLVLAVKYDFFPIEGTRETVERTKRFWQMFGKTDHYELYEDYSVHRYTEKMAKKAAEFFTLHLHGKRVSVQNEKVKTLSGEKLWCTQSGQVLVDYPDSRIVNDENVDKAKELCQLRNYVPSDQRTEDALNWLSEKVFYKRDRCGLNPRLYITHGNLDELAFYSAIWRSQEDVFNHAYMFRDVRNMGKNLPATIAVWDKGTNELEAHINWIRSTCAKGRSVLVLDVSGCGKLMPHPLRGKDPLEVFEIIHKLNDDLIWMNDSLAAMRVYDVTRSVDVLREFPNIDCSDVQLYGYGRYGIYGKYASAIDKRIANFRWENEITSVSEWTQQKYHNIKDVISTVLPGMLNVFDLPDID